MNELKTGVVYAGVNTQYVFFSKQDMAQVNEILPMWNEDLFIQCVACEKADNDLTTQEDMASVVIVSTKNIPSPGKEG